MQLSLLAPLLLAPFMMATGPSGGGAISYVAANEAYLNVGRADGLTAGTHIKVFRRGRAVGVCQVVEVSARRARCRSEKLAPGDRVAFAVVPLKDVPPRPALELKTRKPMLSVKEVAERRALVQSAPIERLAHKKSDGGLSFSLARASATMRQEVWAISTAPEGVFGRSSVDASARAGLGFFPFAFSAASLRLVGDLIAPPDQRVIQLYVWSASLGVHDGPLVGEVGRFRPRKVPGAYVLDGVQVGGRLLGGTLEVGGYGGAVPDLLSGAPVLDRLTVGAYIGLDAALGPGVVVLPRASAGLMSSGDTATVRGELAAQAQLLWALVGSVGGSIRGGVGGTGERTLSLDAASMDADVAVIEPLTLSAGYRYFSLAADFDAVSAAAPIGGAHHANATAAYDLDGWLVLGATSGVGFDVVAGTTRWYAGPEVGLPHAFGPVGGLDFGYVEELGGWPGRSAWISAHAAELSVLRAVTRMSFFETTALGDSLREGALMLLVDAPISPGLCVRGRAYAQQSLPSADGAARATPTLLMLDVGVTGSL